MSKRSNTTRSGSSAITKSNTTQGGVSSYRQEQIKVSRGIQAMGVPVINHSKTSTIVDNYKVQVSHSQPPNGKGGIIRYTLSQGGSRIYSGTYRYGSSGIAEYGNQKEAERTFRNDLLSEIMDLKRSEE